MNNNKFQYPEKHIIEQTASDVQVICSDFFKFSGLTSFGACRVYSNDDFYYITNNADYVKYHLNQNYLINAPIPDQFLAQKINYLIPKDGKFEQAMDDARNLFNIDNIFIRIEVAANFYDLYFFGAAPGNDSVINFYLNHLDSIDAFLCFFKERALPLLNRHEQKKLSLPRHLRSNICLPKSLTDKEMFLTCLQEAVQQFHGRYSNMKLTRKEIECIKFMLKAKTAKEIAAFLHRSPRTIESHIASIKTKFGVSSKSELLKIISAFGNALVFGSSHF